MATSNTIDRIMDGDIVSLKDVTPKELSSLVTLLQAFHLGKAVGQDSLISDDQYDLFDQLALLKEVFSDTSNREAVRAALLASWPKPLVKTSSGNGSPMNTLSIHSTTNESTSA